MGMVLALYVPTIMMGTIIAMGMVLAIYVPTIMMTLQCNGHGPGSLCANYNDNNAVQWAWSWLFMHQL